MIIDGNHFKIVQSGYGSFSVQDCTVDNAKALLDSYLQNLGKHVTVAADAIRDKTHYIVNTAIVVGALTELLSAKIGQELPKTTRLMHGKPVAGEALAPVVFEAQHMAQVMAWAELNGVAWTNLKELIGRAGYQLETMHPESLFLCAGIYQRAGKLTPMFLDADVLEIADELAVLQRGKWKDTATESNVVQRYLRFISDHLTHRDETFDLGSYDGADA